MGKALPDQDWKKMHQVRSTIDKNWNEGKARPVYFTGHTDSVYCVQFDE